MEPRPASWQLPPGVNRGLWDYLHDPAIARGYDASLAGSPLFAADQAFVLRHCPGPARLVDLGCGTGRLLVALAKVGWRVTGVDLSAEMLAVAGEKARAEGVDVELVQANLAELDALADAGFDHAACLFSTLGMVVGAEARRRVVGHTFRLLRPGGRFVLHVHNRWFHVHDRAGRRWLLADTLKRWLGRPDAGDRVMPAHQGVAGLTLHLFSRRKARRLLTDAGFRVMAVSPVGLREDGSLAWPWLLPGLRAYGFLMAAERP
jgi:ubiquinone/menaquinone biosynthesis C-methylase UbiE